MHRNSQQILVLGVGNILLTDEGFGVHTIQKLERGYNFPSNVTLYDGGTGGLSLLAQIMEVDYLFVIDAMLLGEPPGTLAQFPFDSIPENYEKKDTAHGIDVMDILVAATVIDKLPITIIMGVQPADIHSPGLTLTPPVATSVEPLIETLISELNKLEISVTKKSSSETTKPNTSFDRKF